MSEILRWLEHVLPMKKDRLQKIVLFGQLSRIKRKAGRPRVGWDNIVRKDLREIGTSMEGVRREALNRLGWKESVCSFDGLRQLGAAVNR